VIAAFDACCWVAQEGRCRSDVDCADDELCFDGMRLSFWISCFVTSSQLIISDRQIGLLTRSFREKFGSSVEAQIHGSRVGQRAATFVAGGLSLGYQTFGPAAPSVLPSAHR